MTNELFKLVTYDPSDTFIPGTGLAEGDLETLAPGLEDARKEVLADLELLRSGANIPPEKQPLDAGFIDLPERLLADYRQLGNASELGKILARARQITQEADRVIVVGIGGSYMGSRALFEACCHPYHNELSRAQRGEKPRMYFAGHDVNNDDTQGLLDLLDHGRLVASPDERWCIIVVSKSGQTLEPAVAFRQFLNFLRQSTGGDAEMLARLVAPVTGPGSKLFNLAKELNCDPIFNIPDGVGGRFSVLTAGGLLPAAVLGLDVVKLLQGAAAMNAAFRTAPPGRNPVLDYAGVCHLMERDHGATIRVLAIWDEGFEAFGLWYDQLLSESLGKKERGATPITVINTRDLHSRGQQHQQGRRDKLITNLVIDIPRREPFPVGYSDLDQDDLNQLADKTLPEILMAALIGTNRAYKEDKRPTADLHVPRPDEASLGQLFQMLMLATAVEGRLIGINPYGQPGVEAYKKHMRSILKMK